MTTDSSNSSETLLNAEQRQQLDDICDAFEAEWRQHNWPKTEDYLTSCSEPLRTLLLEELLKIETYWRSQATDVQSLRRMFEKRFPENLSSVATVLGSEIHQPNQHGLQHDTLGPFRDLKKIGDGGFGIVFSAWDTRHQRPVALKIPRLGHQLVGQELKQFLREAKSAGSLDHPNIARVWDSGTADGVTYIAYQLIDGENLKARFSDISQKTPLEIAHFVQHLAAAVHYAHQQGIIHRDIKPSNVLLTSTDQPVLTDFGLALAISGDATRSLAGRIGTLDYMSPEQTSGAQEKVDRRTDLWSLGVVLFELLTETLPFQAATEIQLCNKICETPHKRIRQLKRGIPRDLEIVVDRCLQKRPTDRLSSCGELADELERIQAGKPIVSRRVSTLERSVRWCRRNPRPLLAFLAILLATTFGTWSWGLRLSENRQNENAVQQLQLQLELKNIERRDLLSEMMSAGTMPLRLIEEDLVFFESQIFINTTLEERIYCAEILANNDMLRPDLYPVGDYRRESLRKILEELLAEELAPELRSAVEKALEPEVIE